MDKSELEVIAGPCVLEEEGSDPGLSLEIASELKKQSKDLPVRLTFKASFDKANRSSVNSFRGPGMERGLHLLSQIATKTGLPVLTDIHTPAHADAAIEICQAIQIPAFLCRQTDLVTAAGKAATRQITSGSYKEVHVKKGQFLAPWDARHIVSKLEESGLHKKSIRITERGSSFGYGRLVVDMSSFATIQEYGVHVIYDATHSVQLPGGGPQSDVTGGLRHFIQPLARAAMGAGANGVFLECHPNPEKAKSDAANAFPLEFVGAFLKQLVSIRDTVSAHENFVDQPKL